MKKINKRLFLSASALIVLVMFILLLFRAVLDETQMGPFLRILDTAGVWGLSILGFVFPGTILLLGKDFANRLTVFALAYLASAVIWGIIIERLLCVARRKSSLRMMR